MGIEKLETFNVPRDLLENIQEVLGKSTVITMATMVQFEVKPDKLENRVLVLTEFRLFILVNKIPCKVEQSISFLNIHSLESKSSTKLTVALEGRRLNFVIPDEAKIDKFILHIVESLMVAFPKVPLDHLIGQIEVLPATRQYLRDVTDLKTRQDRRDTGPCGSFSASYRCMADFHNLPFMPDVAWDIDTIYNCHDSRELKLADFDHLDGRHLLPILTALEYNTWFTSLNADHVKLPPDVINSIPMVMRKNSSLEELHLSNIGIKSDFVTRLAQTVVANPSCSLVHIDLSGNVIDDRGLNQLSAAVARLPKGATQLMLSQTSITAKGVNRLAESLCANKQIPNTLTHLDLSKNSFKGEDVTNLFNFLAQPNALMSLNLSGTECALDSIFGALLRGSTQKLEFLDLSNNPYLTKKSGGVQASCKQFFSSALALKHVNLSNTRIPGEAVKFVLLGLGSNPVCNNVEINLSSNNLGQETTILEICLPDLRNITALDISDNGLDMALLSLIPKLAKNRNIKKLSFGRNFGTIKPRNLSQVLEFVTEMIHEEDSELESLSLAGSKLRGHINIFINSLGGNSSLKEIDISGNFMGDGGARMLAKALQINTTLDTLYYDQNNITAQGFSDIAEALDKNYSMKKMPVPLNDVLQSMRYHHEKTESAIQKIESILQRNHSPRKFATDQGYRLQQGFLINTVQQMLDRSVVTLQSTVKKLEDRGNLPENVLEDLTQANCLVKDTSNSRQLLAKFQSVALKSETEEGKIYRELGMVADNLQASIEEQIRMNLEAMLESATDHCPTLLEDEDLHEDIHTSCVEKSHLPKNFTQSLVLDQLGADVLNKLGEVNLLVASHMSDQLIDGVLEALNKTHDKLINHLRAQKKADKSEASESEHRSSLLRNKSVTDDEPLLLDVKAISHTKRKSVYSRKLRPQSSLGVDDHEDRTDAKSDDTDSTDVTTDGSSVGSPLTSREGTPRRSPVHNLTSPKAKTDDKVKAKGDKVKVGDLTLPTDAAAPNLEHLTKSRPKRPKMNRPTTRAGIRSEAIGLDSGLEDVQEEIDNFFTNKPTSPTDGQDPKIINSQNSVDSKDEVKEKKKGWSPFGGKSGEKGLGSLFSKRSQSMKSPEPDKKSSPSHKAKLPEVTEGAEVKSQSRRDRSKSPENELDKDGSKSEEEKDDLEEPKPQPRVMPGIPRMGFPGMGGGLMAEMKAKRASMIPLGSKMDPPAKDDPTKRSPQAPQPQASARPEKTAPSGAKMPPGGRPLFPPSGLKQPTAAPRSVSPNAQADDKTKPPTRPRPPTRPKPGPKSTVSSSPSLPLHSPGGTTSSPGGTTSTGSSGAADTAKPTPTAATKQAVTGPSASEPTKGNGTAGPAANKPAAFTRGFSEAVDETDKQPARSSSPTEVEGPPTLKKRLSVREKAAALDKNRNEYDPNVRVSTGGGTSVEGATRPKPQEVLRSRRSEISTGSTSARSSVSSQHSSTEIVDTDTPSSQSGGRKSPGAEPQTNGSSKPEGKEEFLMYL